MSKTSTLALAIKKFKKGKENRSVTQFAGQVGKLIAKEIKARIDKIKDLREEFEETLQEGQDTFTDSLVKVDGYDLSDTAGRKASATEYIQNAIGGMEDLRESEDDHKYTIEVLETEIKDLRGLETELVSLADKIQVDEEGKEAK